MASYEKRNNKWTVRFRHMENCVEKNKRLGSFSTKREAEIAYLEFVKQNPESLNSDCLFSDLITAYLSDKEHSVRESSYVDIKSVVNARILPFFKSYSIKEVNAKLIEQWQKSISNYSYKYITNLRMYLNSIFEFGSRIYDIQNPMKKVSRPRNLKLKSNKRDMQFWTFEEFNAFINCCEEPFKTMFSLLYFTGLRKGECLALKWSSLKGNTIQVRESVTRKGEYAWQLTPPKNASSIRDVTIHNSMLTQLLEYKGDAKQSDFMFAGDRPIAERTIDRAFKKAIEKSGVKPIRIHDLRHSHASFLISQGMSIVMVSKRLGHSSTQQTLDTYAHLMPSEQDKLLDCLNNLGTKLGTNN